MLKRFALITLTGLLAACSGPNSVESTLVAQQATLSLEIANLRLSATAETDRMMITIEHAQTEVREVNSVGTVLASTLVASGLNPDAISGDAPLFITPTPTPGPTRAPDPLSSEEAAADAPTAGPGPALSNIVMAESVGPDDCAVNPTTQFSAATERIYVVATALNIAPGTTLTSRWQQGGAEQVRFDFTPDFPINNACVWFFVDQTDVAFTPGSWSVQLEINGRPASPPVTFNIVG